MANGNISYVFAAAVLCTACAKNQTTPATETPSAMSMGDPVVTTPATEANGPVYPLGRGAVTAPMQPTYTETEPVAAAQAQGLTDAQILKVTETLSDDGIEQAKLASAKAQNVQVRTFAVRLMDAHAKAKEQEAQLAKQERIAPERSTTSDDIQAYGAATFAALKATEPAHFDRAYVDGQIKQQRHALNLLNQQLIPAAFDPDVKAQLEQTYDMVSQHLAEAQRLQQELTISPTTMETLSRAE